MNRGGMRHSNVQFIIFECGQHRCFFLENDKLMVAKYITLQFHAPIIAQFVLLQLSCFCSGEAGFGNGCKMFQLYFVAVLFSQLNCLNIKVLLLLDIDIDESICEEKLNMFIDSSNLAV